jgi:hypothetical protein
VKIVIAILLVVCVAAGCTSQTVYGDCLGVGEEEDPTLVYDVPTMNIVWSVIFFEMIFPPIVFLATDFKCPVAYKKKHAEVPAQK